MTQGLPFYFSTLSQSVIDAKENIFNNLNCHMVGTIQSFDPITQLATVTINTKRLIALNPDVWVDYPPLIDCPVVIMGNNARLTFPINQGDECIILFNDREIDNWYGQGGSQAFTTHRTHDYSDAIVIVGLRNALKALTTYNNEAIELNYNDTSKVSIYQDKINIDSEKLGFFGVNAVAQQIVNVSNPELTIPTLITALTNLGLITVV